MATPPNAGSGSPGDDLRGRLLAGRYRLNQPIASGGMAQVWEATDEILARRVAVKILHPHLARDESFVRRFRAEAIAAARLAHPSIVSVYDTVAEDGTNAIVMELVTGTTMRADLDQHGPLQFNALLAIGTQVADALGAAHANGLVHRDVKPANILLSADGRVLVADFGIAKAAEGSDLTSAGSMVGTAKYLAPEQVEDGPIDGRADLYSLGVVLYEALTGRPPFVAETDAGTALARLHRDPTPPRELRPEISPAVAAVVTKAMARRPDDRYPDAASMRRALLAAGADPAQAHAVAQAAASTSDGLPDLGDPRLPVMPHPSHHRAPAPPAPPVPPPVPIADHPAEVHGRRWPLALLAVVVVIAAVAGVVVTLQRMSSGGGAAGAELALASVTDFDPQGDGAHREHPELVKNVVDDDPTTSWRSENYRAADLGAKDGVGLALTTASSADLGQLDVVSPTGGWTAQIYVVDGPAPNDLGGWGKPVASSADVAAGTVRFALHGQRGKAVLIWFTQLSTMANGSHAVVVDDITLRSS